eukprot:TRINITY_DN61177_c0_g1_i1.p1 TRINITY_DN61177_c0_g1~~TRINITY_DN61177_c0_g1_i1.p1  ORF type:complete len:287 (+),score=30.77 TRINITY_DN61177_c0_g1_i1:51-863(+)
MRCEVEPTTIVSDWLEAKDISDFEYTLDGWWHFDIPSDQAEYYSINVNAEIDTGYDGRAVWKMIYDTICFPRDCDGASAAFNTAVAGMHASISAHIVDDIRKRVAVGDKLGHTRAMQEFSRRLRERPEAIDCLKSTRSLAAQAIQAITPQLVSFDYGEESSSLIPLVQRVCQDAMEECHQTSEPFVFQDGPYETTMFRMRLRHLCYAMDCVQCSLCRIHGKIYALAIAVVFRILFCKDDVKSIALKRIEVAALLVFFGKLTEALNIIQTF